MRKRAAAIQLGNYADLSVPDDLIKIMIRPIGLGRNDQWETENDLLRKEYTRELFNSFRIEFADVTPCVEFEIKFQPVPNIYMLDHYKSDHPCTCRIGAAAQHGQHKVVTQLRSALVSARSGVSAELPPATRIHLGQVQDLGKIVRFSVNQRGRTPSDDKKSCHSDFKRRRPRDSSTKESYVKYDSPVGRQRWSAYLDLHVEGQSKTSKSRQAVISLARSRKRLMAAVSDKGDTEGQLRNERQRDPPLQKGAIQHRPATGTENLTWWIR